MEKRYAQTGIEEFDDLEEATVELDLAKESLKQGHDGAIFPGGPLRSQIDSWKKQHNEVYMTEIGEEVYIWRPLNRFEYKTIVALKNTDPLQREELICEQCVLYPLEYDISAMANGKAGVPALLAESIMEASGFTRSSPPQIL